jgi:hypothetical protein
MVALGLLGAQNDIMKLDAEWFEKTEPRGMGGIFQFVPELIYTPGQYLDFIACSRHFVAISFSAL